ncbi:MAG: DNA-3-methyladenine glycosylase I [Pseudotabrizicola sp.]|uniref:DNA-3-methyladenine glycosylase I n=1 Tax=Pseudotabrizicola sp. TaxID=2939647 RepID=UPI0027163692|nr:DNA-3-methyladenine glycosylase I [Pseudotabrizicola sp.]MDO8884625.1 DNA-3-methyladenine glycosylase I [Pseudotabrizicola sp.]MDP2082174.1 DNA-3-methyladenine glycosylase I [Pseudotabrizicola sp.]MDZ7573213.1 DNA-3-methyladenine glycosylase I [Pseudotabrizicola sp.]
MNTQTALRCGWCGTEQIYVDYHDHEWGVPERDGRTLWEKLILDGFQAGLSWITILKKRDNFRAAFDGFRPDLIASWTEEDITRLLANPGIVRHRGKIAGTIQSARAYQRIEQREGFANFIWQFQDGTVQQNQWESLSQVPAQTPVSQAMSKALKAEGFTFCGPTIVYAFMQATGMVNDHLLTCPCHARVAALA